jgi:hypothetical protein
MLLLHECSSWRQRLYLEQSMNHGCFEGKKTPGLLFQLRTIHFWIQKFLLRFVRLRAVGSWIQLKIDKKLPTNGIQ